MTLHAALVMAAGGAVLSAALPPTGAWPLLLALVPLFVATADSRSPREAFWLGFVFGLAFFALYVLWLPASFSAPDIMGPFFWVLYPPMLLILASFWGIVTAAARWLGGGGGATLAALPPLWVAMEWARTQGYFGFPWGTLGYAWLDTPLAQVADTIGVWGLSLLSAAAVALLAAPFTTLRRPRLGGERRALPARLVPPLAALTLLAAAWLTGAAKLERPLPTPERSTLLVQGNLDPYGRLLSSEGEVRAQARLTSSAVAALESPPELVVWPEGAVLAGLGGARGRETLLEVQASSPESVFLVGARVLEDNLSYNSAYVIADGALVDRYDKRYLVPFGERFPFVESGAPVYRAVFGLLGLPELASTSPGQEMAPLASPLGRIAAYICYESVFPQVQRAMVRAGAQVLVNITNDAWFSRGNGAAQHYAMGSMRAIETRRFILRAGNDGITGVVDPLGRTVAQIERGTAGTLEARYALMDEITPYVRYGHLLLPLLGLWLLLPLVGRIANR